MHLPTTTFENIVLKRAISHNEPLFVLPQYNVNFSSMITLSLTLSLIRQFCSRRLNIFCQNIENLRNWMDNLWQKVENIVAKGEIARFVQFLLLSLCFQKAVCCRGVRRHLYEGKGWSVTYCGRQILLKVVYSWIKV